jgi:hypothetical protein
VKENRQVISVTEEGIDPASGMPNLIAHSLVSNTMALVSQN